MISATLSNMSDPSGCQREARHHAAFETDRHVAHVPAGSGQLDVAIAAITPCKIDGSQIRWIGTDQAAELGVPGVRLQDTQPLRVGSGELEREAVRQVLAVRGSLQTIVRGPPNCSTSDPSFCQGRGSTEL